ncbi:hypothetical protein LTR36_008703 [Oleoguttula mirabilis]|uniref:Uncharacterized protein n=1 Tax=Oleoguttula mirabilis TaxID=1507867 RepID=A0AAV9JTQ0_9PEZI|nr:hypothetical protein LTR36_008703 [Oleoguttula mirabilis]
MASDFERKIPAELRCEIYGYVLRFDHPLQYKHSSSTSPRHVTPAALLSVSKSIHHEATDVFYGHNTFIIQMADTCCSNSGSIALRKRVYQQPFRRVRIIIDRHRTPQWQSFEVIFKVIESLSNTELLPTLRTVTVRDESAQGTDPRVLCKFLKGRGEAVLFTDVGRFDVGGKECSTDINGRHGPRWTFEYPAVTAVWSYLAHLDPESAELLDDAIIAHLQPYSPELVKAARWALVRIYANERSQRIGTEGEGGLKCWAEWEHSAEEYEDLTLRFC